MYSYLTLFFTIIIYFKGDTQFMVSETFKDDLKLVIVKNDSQDEEWYENQMDLMELEGTARQNYKIIVKYHVYKILQLKTKYTNKLQIKRAFPKQIKKLNRDVSFILDKHQLIIHKKIWKLILNKIYQSKNWKLTDYEIQQL